MAFYCDWCGKEIKGKAGRATLKIEGMFEKGGISDLIRDDGRHFHAGRSDDEDSCLRMVLQLVGRKSYLSPSVLDGIPTVDEQEIIQLRAKHRGGTLDSSMYRAATVLSDGLHGIGLSLLALRALWNAGVHTLEDVAGLTEDELLAIKHVGPKTVEILRAALEAHGPELGG
jgi:hypothetical protein